jgi:hypothetical protein
VLIVWLTVRVFNPVQLPSSDTFWDTIANRIDTSLKAVGLPLERWYVIVALVIAYLVSFQWVRSLLLAFRPFHVPYPRQLRPELLGDAARAFRIRPGELWTIERTLQDRVEELNREVRESGVPHPYQWRFNRVSTWYAYYGTVLVMLVLSLVWLIQGGTYARPDGRVWELVLLLAVASIALRWKTKREIANRETDLGYWALRQSEKNTKHGSEGPLEWKRRDFVAGLVRYQRAIANHPSYRLSTLAHRWLPHPLAKQLNARLRWPSRWEPDRDWAILESAAMTQADDQHLPPKALRVDAFVGRFDALLECTGAGVFILVPQSLGLAPSVQDGGASYCLATRRHGEYRLRIRLEANDDLSFARLTVDSGPKSPAFLVEVGEYPVERLAQFDFPSSNGSNWYQLSQPNLDDQAWTHLGNRKPMEVGNVTLRESADLHLGSSYLFGARTELNTRVSAVFQCFRIVNTPKILIAWRILRTAADEPPIPHVPPWWKLSAWKGAFRVAPTPLG